MISDAIQQWIERAAHDDAATAAPSDSVRVIHRKVADARGHRIMELAEKLRPWIAKMFDGVRDENGMLVQPPRVRGIALNLAQRIASERP